MLHCRCHMVRPLFAASPLTPCGAHVHALTCLPLLPCSSWPALFLPAEGGYIRLDLQSVAGTGGIASIELRKSPLAVSGQGQGQTRVGECHVGQQGAASYAAGRALQGGVMALPVMPQAVQCSAQSDCLLTCT